MSFSPSSSVWRSRCRIVDSAVFAGTDDGTVGPENRTFVGARVSGNAAATRGSTNVCGGVVLLIVSFADGGGTVGERDFCMVTCLLSTPSTAPKLRFVYPLQKSCDVLEGVAIFDFPFPRSQSCFIVLACTSVILNIQRNQLLSVYVQKTGSPFCRSTA